MISIKNTVERLIDNKNLNLFQIGLFSIDCEFYEVAKILYNNGIFPKAIVSLFDNNIEENIMGIPFCSIYQFSNNYNEAVILIRLSEYIAYKDILKKNGFIINKNLFVDCEVKNLLQICVYSCRNIHHTMKITIQKFRGKLKGIKRYIHCFWDQIQGYILYRKIRKQYQNCDMPIYIYDYTGMGDIYVFCLFLGANYNTISPNGIVLTVIGNVGKRITAFFQIERVITLTRKESAFLTHFSRLMGNKFNLHPITPFPAHMHTDVYSHFIYGKKLNMAEAYKIVMFSLNNNLISYPVFKKQPDKVKELFDHYNLCPHNTVIISPYANTILGYSKEFWLHLVQQLKGEGFNVCTNCSGREKPLANTIAFSFPLEIAEEVADYAGYFLGLRSGFCDLICNSIAYKCIIYPDYPIFNSNVYDFCSLKKMNIGKNYKEICWAYDDLNTLQLIIIKSFKHAKIYKKTNER